MKTKLFISILSSLFLTLDSFGQAPSTDGTFTATTADDNLELRTSPSGVATTRLWILPNGNVGIGFSNPGSKLSVNGTINASGTITSGSLLSSGNVQSTGGLYTINHASNDFVLRLNTTDRFVIDNGTGNVGIGIGTATPSEKLHVSGNILSTGNFTGVNFVSSGNVSTTGNFTGVNFVSSGNVSTTTGTVSTSSGNIFSTSGNVYTTSGSLGVGTASPSQKLHIESGDFLFNDNTPTLYTGTAGTNQGRFLVLRNSPATTTMTSGLKAGGVVVADTDDYADPGKNDLVVKGKIIIGQPSVNANYDLGVKGKIGAKDLQLETTSWSDYVFASDYKLPSLGEVERYINENKHLEGVPSEADVKANGYSVNEMDVVLLKKVEELTLYVIEQQKQIDELKKQLQEKSSKRKKK